MPGSEAFETVNARRRREQREWDAYVRTYYKNPPPLKPMLCGNCNVNHRRSPSDNLCEPCFRGGPVVMPSSTVTEETNRASA